MPWQEVSVMEERLRFIARLLDGEGMSLERNCASIRPGAAKRNPRCDDFLTAAQPR